MNKYKQELINAVRERFQEENPLRSYGTARQAAEKLVNGYIEEIARKSFIEKVAKDILIDRFEN